MRFDRRWRGLEEELQAHRRLAAEDGNPPGSRDRSPDATREAVRDQWPGRWGNDAGRDLRFALRSLRRSPGFALAAIATLALGLGAAIAMFSLVDTILLQPLPYAQPQALVTANQFFPAGGYVFLRDHLRTLTLGAYNEEREFQVTGAGWGSGPQVAVGAEVSADLFPILGVRPALGPGFARAADEPGHDAEVVLSHRLWVRMFQSDPTILGRSLVVDGAARAVVGVMPAGFHFLTPGAELWLPLTLDPAVRGQYWYGSYMPVVGRLRPGMGLAQARAELTGLGPQLAAAFPGTKPASAFRGASLLPLRQALVGDIGGNLWLLLGAVGLLLAIAWVNVANLLRARAASRTQEMGLRTALGAGRGRLLRQRTVESLLLALVGGMAGIALAAAAVPLLKALLPEDLPRLAELTMHARVAWFGLGLALLCGGAFACLGQGGNRNLRADMNARRSRGGRGLVMAEVALSAMLVVAAGLTLRSLMRLTALNPGFRAGGVVTALMTPNPALCRPAERCQALYAAVLERVRALPGVTTAAMVNGLPLGGEVEITTFQTAGTVAHPDLRHPLAFGTIVTPGYFAALGIPLLQGRRFTPADMAAGAPPVVIVSQSSAARLWPGRSALGQRFKSDGERQWRTVVGVVGDVGLSAVLGRAEGWRYDGIYSPYAQAMLACAPCDTPPVALTLVARVAPGHTVTATALRRTVAMAAPSAAVSQVEPLGAWVRSVLREPRATMWLFALAAGLALLLGAVGLYGVLAYQVAGRSREIGIRMALGAGRGRVLAAITSEGVGLAAAGCAAGLLAAWWTARLLAGLLYQFNPRDPLTYAAVAGLWLLLAGVASAVPARRAARVDPARVLRGD